MKYSNWREAHATVLQTLSSPKNRNGLTVQEIADHTNVPLAISIPNHTGLLVSPFFMPNFY